VTVAVTPNGYADAVTDDKFVMPEERRMTMSEFLDTLDHSGHDGGGDNSSDVFYIQKQNSNLTDEFTAIMKDVDESLAIGNEAFGKILIYFYECLIVIYFVYFCIYYN
jgi:jumonji domain-containing protein 7